MAMNARVVEGVQGKWKIMTMIIGAVVIALLAHASNYRTSMDHENFFSASILCFIISVLLFITAATGLGEALGTVFLRLDAIFHLLAAVLLVASSIIFIVNITDHRLGIRFISDSIHAERISAGALGILNSILYAQISWINLK